MTLHYGSGLIWLLPFPSGNILRQVSSVSEFISRHESTLKSENIAPRFNHGFALSASSHPEKEPPVPI
jgi:hypothetical protein